MTVGGNDVTKVNGEKVLMDAFELVITVVVATDDKTARGKCA